MQDEIKCFVLFYFTAIKSSVIENFFSSLLESLDSLKK